MQYLESAIRQFKLYQSLGEKAIAQMAEEDLFFQANDDANSVGLIVQHLWGNMLSRWTDFRTTDGEKEWRKRDGEFEVYIRSRTELMQKWDAGWDCLYTALRSIKEEELEQIIYIRNEPHTILEAINRQIGHYSYHVGQIVFIAKLHSKNNWQTLSIARNKSDEYNKQKFG